MRTFIQLKDGIGWASVNTAGEIEGAIEVESGTGDFYIKKKYQDGVWSNAELIQFAHINNDGQIIERKNTYFTSEVDGPLLDDSVDMAARFIDNQWVNPTTIEPIVVVSSNATDNEVSNVEESQA